MKSLDSCIAFLDCCPDMSRNNHLVLLDADFFSLLNEASVVDGDLLTWTRKLKELMENTLGWNFEQTAVDGLHYDEDDEYAPVVEMLDEPDFD
ncbi:hypothetical protein Ancab_034841 [Ancistrocladus abbreviatus]